jgi:hypothetical protein
MVEESYEFDPCTIDGSDESTEGFQSIDDWRPTVHKRRIPRSQWREVANQGRFDLKPGIDELRKIEGYIRKKFDDYDIMEVFGINAETLIAIKHGNYDPLDGISLDNQSKIYREFKKVERDLQKISYALTMVADMLKPGHTSISLDHFKMTIGYDAIKKKERQQRDAEEARELAAEERRLKKNEPKPIKTPKPPKEKLTTPKKEKKAVKRVNITFTKKGHLTKFE